MFCEIMFWNIYGVAKRKQASSNLIFLILVLLVTGRGIEEVTIRKRDECSSQGLHRDFFVQQFIDLFLQRLSLQLRLC